MDVLNIVLASAVGTVAFGLIVWDAVNSNKLMKLQEEEVDLLREEVDLLREERETSPIIVTVGPLTKIEDRLIDDGK